MPESFERGALTEATFLILVSLCEPRHGYGVMQHINAMTNGRVNLGAGTLYGALNLLCEKGWISAEGAGERKKNYLITDEGKRAALNEMNRLFELMTIGRDSLFIDGFENKSERAN